MKTVSKALLAVAACSLCGLTIAAAPRAGRPSDFTVKSYQVTGKVLSVDDKSIVVQKDQDRWELQRTDKTTVTGTPAVGSKVTIKYYMVADTVEVK